MKLTIRDKYTWIGLLIFGWAGIEFFSKLTIYLEQQKNTAGFVYMGAVSGLTFSLMLAVYSLLTIYHIAKRAVKESL